MNNYKSSCEVIRQHQIIFNKNSLNFSTEPKYRREKNIDYFSYVLNCNNIDIYNCVAITQGKAFTMEYILKRPVQYKGIFKNKIPGDYTVDISFIEIWKSKYKLHITESSLGIFEDDDHYLYDSFEYNSHCHFKYKIIIFVSDEVSEEIYNTAFNYLINSGEEFYHKNTEKINQAVLRLVNYDENNLKTVVDTGFCGSHIVLHKNSLDLYNHNMYSVLLRDINVSELKNDNTICGFALGIKKYFEEVIKNDMYCRKNSITLIYINNDEIHIIMKKQVENIDLFYEKQNIIVW